MNEIHRGLLADVVIFFKLAWLYRFLVQTLATGDFGPKIDISWHQVTLCTQSEILSSAFSSSPKLLVNLLVT